MNIRKKLTSLKPPYIHLAIGTTLEFFNLVKKISSFEQSNCFVKFIDGQKCSNIDELFEEFSDKFDFPNYFGSNWAAFDECINDLDWILTDCYTLFIGNINKVLRLDDHNFKVFIKTLMDSVREWTDGRNFDSFPTPPTPFHVVFHCVEEKKGEVKKRLASVNLNNVDIINLTV